MDELERLRTELARTDQELLQLFLRRMQIVADVAEYKMKTQSAVFVPEQETKVIRDVQAKTPPELGPYATVLAGTLMRLSRERQYELLLAMDPSKAEDYASRYSSLGAGKIRLLVHNQRETPRETPLALVMNIFSDLGLPVTHVQSLDSGRIHLEFLVTSRAQAWRAFFQIEQEVGEIYLLGYNS